MAAFEVETIRRARLRHRVVRQIPFLVVLGVVAVGAVFVLVDRWRRGSVIFGGAFLLGAVLRTVMKTDAVGLLQVRSKPFDIAWMTSTGLLVIWLAMSIDSLGTGDQL
ncbi:hypothetical protein C6V83_06845 [Gordonia iterans]|uniref:DUF3017 domain-containing protein n=1 Tax=Gordonia iterans TaxID=1004901 RepID=A0A2S0KEC1_9ACTN|nr:DUF3017 domain-containing protein [Gordonia iterans]AVM00030.1 hypothetical protein C6V83_06845 [Gordonia iterans]